MGSFSIWHWAITIFWICVFVIPGWRIVSKAGYHGAWSLLLLVPIVNLVMLWIFAFLSWPARPAK